ncbi:Sugar phosphate isomerase/epimerase [Cohnella sp. OV330]|uniref:sugar phosphate isomerase/epimerase family protein n=1 Tax=Cohnella sp. OV330 TaxID=1855288 RepID=UPI0008DF3AFF|nr:sugar phosphate isomerase/epimerase [Cohnella sp. OV330]SFB06054.1 Sugar phosphate isomerase/epimerase [Cohnella sp. OV330]
MAFPVALQPFTIREELDRDYLGAFERVARIGYAAVEIGPPPAGIEIADMKARFDRIGLQVISAHAGIEQLTDGLDSLADFLKLFGAKYAVLSHRFDTREEVLESAALFNRIGEACRARGLQFLYHNHDWEFVRFGEETALDLLLRETDPELVKMELDVYWAKIGGVEPAAYLRGLRGRCPLLHVKDMEPGDEQFFAEVGEGILDFGDILKAAEEAGTEWLVVEQDHCRRPVFDCIETSYRNLQRMGAVRT